MWIPISMSSLLLTAFLSPQSPEVAKARLEGQVFDAMRQPVGQALVVVELDGEEIGRTHSDATGTFVFASVPQRFVIVRVTTQAPDIGAVQVDLLGETVGFAAVVLMPARRVSGFVKDDAGKPVAGAWVLASPSDLPELGLASCVVRSGTDGRYELTHVAMGPALVRAWAPDYSAFEGRVDGVEDMAVECVIDREVDQELAFELVGATAAQAASATLHVDAERADVPLPLPKPLSRPVASRPGHWTVRGWPHADEVHARVVVPAATVDPAEHTILFGVGHVERRFVVGHRNSRLTGVLHGGDGIAVGGVRLLAQSLTPPLSNGNRFTAVSGPDGAFELQSPSELGDYFALRSLSPEVVMVGNSTNPVWILGRQEGDTALRIELGRAHTVKLRVVTPKGTPAAGARVRLDRTDVPPLPNRAGPGDPRIGLGCSDLDGRVSIACLSIPALARLQFEVSGAFGCVTRQFRVTEDVFTDAGTVMLEAAATLHGVERGADGTPLSGARIRVEHPRGGSSYVLVTDRSGRWLLPGLLPGDYEVQGDNWKERASPGRGDSVELPHTNRRHGR